MAIVHICTQVSMHSYCSPHYISSLAGWMNVRAAQMIDVVGWLIITCPSSCSFSLHPQGSHLPLTPHLPHI